MNKQHLIIHAMYKNILVTGGCGFIGSHFVRLAKERFDNVIVLDALTYAAINAPSGLKQSNGHMRIDNVDYYVGSILSRLDVKYILGEYNIDVVVNFAAESHVDNSISSVSPFIDTNVTGVANLLDICKRSWRDQFATKRFIQVSTDEVYGSLGLHEESFTEKSPYKPRNPYAASKAGGDHLVDAFVNTYGFPAIITHCCNNYGPGQHEEKFIPKTIKAILKGENIKIYGNGQNVREWIYVEDHCRGILHALDYGKIGEHYNFGSGQEMSNLDLALWIRRNMEHLTEKRSVVEFIEDRKGHDLRYSVNSDKASKDIYWGTIMPFAAGLKETIDSYTNSK